MHKLKELGHESLSLCPQQGDALQRTQFKILSGMFLLLFLSVREADQKDL